MGTDFDKAVHSILQTDREINICFIKRILSGSIICLRKRTIQGGRKSIQPFVFIFLNMTRSKLDGNSIVCAEKLGVIRLVARWDRIAPRAPFKQPPSHQDFESTRLCDCTPIVLPPFQIVDPETKWLDTYFDCFFLNHALKSFFSYLSMTLTEKTVQLTTPIQNTSD